MNSVVNFPSKLDDPNPFEDVQAIAELNKLVPDEIEEETIVVNPKPSVSLLYSMYEAAELLGKKWASSEIEIPYGEMKAHRRIYRFDKVSEIDILSDSYREMKYFGANRRTDRFAKAFSYFDEADTFLSGSRKRKRYVGVGYREAKIGDQKNGRRLAWLSAGDFAAINMDYNISALDFPDEMNKQVDMLMLLSATEKVFKESSPCFDIEKQEMETELGFQGARTKNGKLAYTAFAVGAQVGVAALPLAMSGTNSSDQTKLLLRFAMGSNAVGFGGSLASILLERKKKSAAASIMEGIGCAGAAIGFMMMMGLLFV